MFYFCPICVIPVCRTLRRDCCSVLSVLWSPAAIPGRCWFWQPAPSPFRPLSVEASRPCPAATAARPCWSAPPWASAPARQGASASGSSAAPNRPGPSPLPETLPTHPGSKGSPSAGTEAGVRAPLLQDKEKDLACQFNLDRNILKKYVLYSMNLGSTNEIWMYYIHHVVTFSWPASVCCITISLSRDIKVSIESRLLAEVVGHQSTLRLPFFEYYEFWHTVFQTYYSI